jgi:hypothetical protein
MDALLLVRSDFILVLNASFCQQALGILQLLGTTALAHGLLT